LNIFCKYFELTFDRVRNILIVSFCLMGTGRILNRLRQNIPDFNSIGTFFEKDFVLIFNRIRADFEQNVDTFQTDYGQDLNIFWNNLNKFCTYFKHITKRRWTESGQFFAQILDKLWTYVGQLLKIFSHICRKLLDLSQICSAAIY